MSPFYVLQRAVLFTSVDFGHSHTVLYCLLHKRNWTFVCLELHQRETCKVLKCSAICMQLLRLIIIMFRRCPKKIAYKFGKEMNDLLNIYVSYKSIV